MIEHFAIVSLLGEGGMGQVFVARDTRLQRMVALKIVHPAKEGSRSSDGSSSGGAARLLREAQAAAALDHPNVVTIYEVGEIQGEGEEAGRPYIAMELVKGRPLRAFVGDETVPMDQRIRWLADIARALAAAHRANLVHRDIKPENVMVRDDGAIKVLDFGVAKRAVTPSMSSTTSTEGQVLPSLTAKGVAVGTPYYMAPEQMRREGLDGRADQFSWGVVAYELLSGEPPWGRDADALQLVSKLLTETPVPLDHLRADVPGDVAAVVAKAMAKKRGDRFETMDDVVNVLAPAILSSGSANATPRVSVRSSREVAEAAALPLADTQLEFRSSPETKKEKTARSKRAALWSLGAVAAVGLGGAGWLVSKTRAHVLAAGSMSARSSSSAAAPSECTRHTECIAKLGGKPAVCNPSGKCAPIESAECKAYYEPEDLKRDDTVWIGAMFPIHGDEATFGVSNMNAVELARRDFAQASTSLRSAAGQPLVSAISLVGCDDSSAYASVAEHLVHAVGVPVVLGIGVGRAVSLATSVFVPNDVLTIPSLTLSPLLASVPHAVGQPRMVWHTSYDNVETASAIAELIEKLEAESRRRRSFGSDATIRVAVVRAKSANSSVFAERFFEVARFNGKSALENGAAYREFSFSRAEHEDYSDLAVQVALFEPTFVVFMANSDSVPKVEASWSSKSKPRPYYISPSILDAELLHAIGTSQDLRHRLFGFTSVSATTTNARFVVHYNETFDDKITRSWAPNSSYDAFYLAAYAAYAIGAEPPTGRHLAGAIARLLPPGLPVEVGPSGILGAFAQLSRGASIDLVGATGNMDFDVKTGEAPIDLAVVCAGIDERGVADEAIESGLIFDGKRGQLTGERRCP